MNQARDSLKVISDMYPAEGDEYKAWENASIQVQRMYYQEPQASNYNLHKALLAKPFGHINWRNSLDFLGSPN